MSALLTFRTQIAGFTNRDLRHLTAELRGLPSSDVTTGQATYDLRRLRSHGLIERLPLTYRYRVTDTGLRTAMLITRVHDRLLPTALALQADLHTNHRLTTASAAYQRAIDCLAQQNGLAA